MDLETTEGRRQSIEQHPSAARGKGRQGGILHSVKIPRRKEAPLLVKMKYQEMNLLLHRNNRNPKRAREAAMATQRTDGLLKEGNTQGMACDCSKIVQGAEQGNPTHIEHRSLPQLRK